VYRSRRSSPFPAPLVAGLVGVVGLAACSSSSGGAPPASPARSVNLIGDPSDTASPVDTSRPAATQETAAIPTVAPASPASPTSTVDPGSAVLVACLNGNWTAPVSREFSALGLGDRSKGTVRGGSGLLRITFGLDRSYTFTYEDVTLDLAIGTATVDGPVTGTWRLAGNTLSTEMIKRSTEVKVNVGPVSVGAPSSVASAVETLPPPQVLVTCEDKRLTMQLPTGQGGGTVGFDRA
jgi:hypothetical protein